MKNRNLKESFSHAFNGMFQAFKTESNIRRHCLIGTVTIVMGIVMRISYLEWALVALTIGFVIVTELLNTAIEYTVDLVCGKTYNELAKYSKDIAAGATLMASCVAVVIGLIIFLPKILVIIR